MKRVERPPSGAREGSSESQGLIDGLRRAAGRGGDQAQELPLEPRHVRGVFEPLLVAGPTQEPLRPQVPLAGRSLRPAVDTDELLHRARGSHGARTGQVHSTPLAPEALAPVRGTPTRARLRMSGCPVHDRLQSRGRPEESTNGEPGDPHALLSDVPARRAVRLAGVPGAGGPGVRPLHGVGVAPLAEERPSDAVRNRPGQRGLTREERRRGIEMSEQVQAQRLGLLYTLILTVGWLFLGVAFLDFRRFLQAVDPAEPDLISMITSIVISGTVLVAGGGLVGAYGPPTEGALRAVREAQGLAVDDIVGPVTTASLGLSLEPLPLADQEALGAGLRIVDCVALLEDLQSLRGLVRINTGHDLYDRVVTLLTVREERPESRATTSKCSHDFGLGLT